MFMLNLFFRSSDILSRITKNPNMKNDFEYQNWYFAIKVDKF